MIPLGVKRLLKNFTNKIYYSNERLNIMKKLGICICYQHRNYGSQLQSYATTVELKRRGIDFEIIRYKKKITPALLIKSLPRLVNPVFINDRVLVRYQKKLKLKMRPQLENDNNLRNACLAKFSKERFTNLSPIYYGYDQLCKESAKYDAVMVGSDQLWAPGGITSNFYNLMFADENTTKISYAASFEFLRLKKRCIRCTKSFSTEWIISAFVKIREKACGTAQFKNCRSCC